MQSEAFLQMSEDGQEILIYKKKLQVEDTYVLEADAATVKRLREENTILTAQSEKIYSLKKSSTSIKLNDVIGIIYGGLSSRFWMLRKLFNTYDKKCINNGELPYYAWECITLQMSNREIDLVIKNERDMDEFIMIIVKHMNTLDGHKDSAEPFKIK